MQPQYYLAPLDSNSQTRYLYYLSVGGIQRGPYAFDQIQSMWMSGKITVETLFWCEPMTQWQQIQILMVPRPLSVMAPARSPLPQRRAAWVRWLYATIAAIGALFLGVVLFSTLIQLMAWMLYGDAKSTYILGRDFRKIALTIMVVYSAALIFFCAKVFVSVNRKMR